MDKIINRALRAALLDREFFQEVEKDIDLNQEALLVVIIVSVAGGVAAFIAGLINGNFGPAVLGLSISTAVGITNYYIWAYVTHYIGTKMFTAQAEPGELLRVLGYASAPRVLSLLVFFPYFGPLLGFAGSIWALVAGFVGAREALDLDTAESLATVFLGWLTILIIGGAAKSILGISAIGLGSLLSLLG